MGYLSIKTHWAPLTCHCASVQKAAWYLQRELHLHPSELMWGEPTLWSGLIPPAVFFERDTCAIHQREPKWDEKQALLTETGKKRRCESGAVTAMNPHTFPRNRTDLNMHVCEGCPGARELPLCILHPSIWCLDHTEIHQEPSWCLPVNCRNLPI